MSSYFESRKISPKFYKNYKLPYYISSRLLKWKNLSILDFGCGFEQTLLALRDLGYENVMGCDVDDEAIKYCISQGLKVENCSNLDEFVAKYENKFDMALNAQSNVGAYWAYEDFTHELIFTSGSLYYVLKMAGFEEIYFTDVDCTEGLSAIKKIIRKFLLKIHKAKIHFWNRITCSSFHKQSPEIYSWEIKVLAVKKVSKLFSHIKAFIKFFLYNILDSLITLQKKEFKIKQNTKNILLIRLDAIGDYILFRNFIEILKKEPKYSEYKITLIGNIIWKELAETLDKEYISEFIWIDTKKIHRDIIYRYKILKKVHSTYYDVVIHPTYSRTYDADNIVKISNANEKIGSIGDLSNISKWQKKITDKYYTMLIPAQKDIMFEFYRNKEFFENLLNKKLDITKPYIKLPTNYTFNLELPQSNYAVLFIGASANFKKWSIENFGKVAKWIKCNLGYEIVLCGGKEDIESTKIFKQVYNDTYLNLVGKTSLIDLLFIIKNSKIIISNETFFPHMAVALNSKNIFVIYNGNHFGRFIPYPREITENYFPIYHPEIEKNLKHYEKLSNMYGYRSQLDINEITPQQVIRKIIDNMEEKHDR